MLLFWDLFIDFSLALACDWKHVSGAPLLFDDNTEAPIPTHSYVCFLQTPVEFIMKAGCS